MDAPLLKANGDWAFLTSSSVFGTLRRAPATPVARIAAAPPSHCFSNTATSLMVCPLALTPLLEMVMVRPSFEIAHVPVMTT